MAIGELRLRLLSRSGALPRAWRALGQIAQHKALAVVGVGLLALTASATLSLVVSPRLPEPRIHDEFGYLLTADTFAHGRLTNPTHPLWPHFESMHIIHRPSYNSKYPPGLPLVIAAGQVLFGHPIVGVWLSTALACGGICAMLIAWLPPRWALLGGLLAVAHPLIEFDWGQTYWGGGVAVFGGALVLGALGRLLKGASAPAAFVMAAGMAILANTRPYEGFILSALAVAALGIETALGRGLGPSLRIWLTRVLVPWLIVLIPTALAMGVLHQRVTGNPLKLPYLVHEQTYLVTPIFLWEDLRPVPAYRHDAMRRLYTEDYLDYYRAQDTLPEAIRHYGWKLDKLFWAYLPAFDATTVALPILAVPLVALPWVWRNHRMRLALLILAGFLASFTVTIWCFAYFAAPATCLVFLIEVQALRQLRLWRRSRVHAAETSPGVPFGCWMFRAVLIVFCAAFALRCVRFHRYNGREGIHERGRITERLIHSGGRHLVMVRYGPEHDGHQEWVYNGADIDGSPVIWAREFERLAQNAGILRYYHDRKIWLLEADAHPPRITPYPGTDSAGAGEPRDVSRSFQIKQRGS
jgi:hypothetical protein